jgi:hypothetical protein
MFHGVLPGLVDESHWTFMAATMSEALSAMAKSGEVDPEAVPPAIRDASQEFFRLVCGAIHDTEDLDPVGTAANYCIAARALRSTSASTLVRKTLNDTLSMYRDTLGSLERERRSLNEMEVPLYESMAMFFYSIVRTGETRSYERSVGSVDTDEL